MLSLWTIMLVFTCLLGSAVLGAFFVPRHLGGLIRLVLSVGIGLGFVSLFLFFAGAFSAWQSAVFQGLVQAGVVAGIFMLILMFRWQWNLPRFSLVEWASILIGLIIAGFALFAASAPVTDWDGLAYHLAVPKLWLERGGFYWIPFIHHSNFPFSTQMLYAVAVEFNQPAAAKVIHWAFYLMSAIGAAAVAVRLSGRTAGAFAFLVFLALPVAIWEAGSAYVDLATAAYTILSCYCILRFLDFESLGHRQWLLPAAVLAGFAAATKTTGVLWVILGAAWILFALIILKKYSPAKALLHSVSFGFVGVLAPLPWYVKSFVYTGNPVYPFAYSVFGGKGWDEAGVAMYADTWQRFGVGHSPIYFLRIPWDFLASGGSFIDGDFFFGSPGAFLALLLPVAALRFGKKHLPLILVCLFYLLFWFTSAQQTRYLMPWLVLATALVTVAVEGRDLVARASRGFVLGLGLISCYLAAALASPALELWRGEKTELEYISRQVNSYWITQWLPPNARVLLYGETRGYYLDQEYIWADIGLSTLIPYKEFSNAGEMLEWLRENGWTHAVINRTFAAEKSRAIQLWNEAIENGLVGSADGYDTAAAKANNVEIWEIR